MCCKMLHYGPSPDSIEVRCCFQLVKQAAGSSVEFPSSGNDAAVPREADLVQSALTPSGRSEVHHVAMKYPLGDRGRRQNAHGVARRVQHEVD